LAAQLWSTTAQQAIDAAPHLAFVYPAEGFPLYCDCAVVCARAARTPGASVLDYLLRPRFPRSWNPRAPRWPMLRALEFLPESVDGHRVFILRPRSSTRRMAAHAGPGYTAAAGSDLDGN
jgi:hypothetical protein